MSIAADRAAPWELQVGPDAALPSPAGVVHVDNPGRAPAATSRWGVPENALGFDPASFQYFAENYVMRGRPIQEMCDHNAQVARDMRHHELAQTWTIVGMLYSGAEQHDPGESRRGAAPVSPGADMVCVAWPCRSCRSSHARWWRWRGYTGRLYHRWGWRCRWWGWGWGWSWGAQCPPRRPTAASQSKLRH